MKRDLQFLIVVVLLAVGCQQGATEVTDVAATPPDQTAASVPADTMASPADTMASPPDTAAPPDSTPQAAVTIPDASTVRRITLADATAALNSGEAVLVDVRGPLHYDAEHAQGAINIPEDLIINRLADIPMGKMIITYCT